MLRIRMHPCCFSVRYDLYREERFARSFKWDKAREDGNSRNALENHSSQTRSLSTQVSWDNPFLMRNSFWVMRVSHLIHLQPSVQSPLQLLIELVLWRHLQNRAMKAKIRYFSSNNSNLLNVEVAQNQEHFRSKQWAF